MYRELTKDERLSKWINLDSIYPERNPLNSKMNCNECFFFQMPIKAKYSEFKNGKFESWVIIFKGQTLGITGYGSK